MAYGGKLALLAGFGIAAVLAPTTCAASEATSDPAGVSTNSTPTVAETPQPAAPEAATPASLFRVQHRPASRVSADFDAQRWMPAPPNVAYLHPSMFDPQPQPTTAQRRSSPETNLMELRWHMGVARAAIPTFEVAGCDVVAPRYFEHAAPQAIETPQAAHRRFGRARRVVSNAVTGFMRTGCS